MGSKSNFLEKAVLDAVLGQTALPSIATVYLALYSASPNGADASGTELTGNGYARVAVTNDPAHWPNATGGSPASKSNGTVITFPAATGDWLSAVSFAIYDSLTVGHELYYGALTEAKVVFNGDVADFPIGSIVITEL